MLMGLCFPKLDAVNETLVVKQSMASMLGMFIPMGVLGICGLLCYLGSGLGVWAAAALPTALMAVLAGASAALLAKCGPGMLRRL